jgi:hypothetical protein
VSNIPSTDSWSDSNAANDGGDDEVPEQFDEVGVDVKP